MRFIIHIHLDLVNKILVEKSKLSLIGGLLIMQITINDK